MGIITITPGSYTPGASSSLNAMADVINAAWDQGNSKASALEGKISDITNETTGWLSTQAAPHITASTVDAPTLVEPVVDIPASASTADIYADFAAEYGKLVTLLSERFVSFRTDYFPDEATAYAAAEDWLQAALSSDVGLPDTVAAQFVDDDKARVLADASRAADNVIATFAARRFPLPTGAAAAAIADIQNKAQDEIAASSRKVVIASIEQVRWVVEKTIGLRQLAMSSALDYIKALASGPDMASRLVNVGYDAQSKLISSVSQYYNSRISAAELTSRVRQYNVGAAMEAASKNQAADLSLIDDRLKALLTECQAIAQMATALFNNVHASAGTSYSVNGT